MVRGLTCWFSCSGLWLGNRWTRELPGRWNLLIFNNLGVWLDCAQTAIRGAVLRAVLQSATRPTHPAHLRSTDVPVTNRAHLPAGKALGGRSDYTQVTRTDLSLLRVCALGHAQASHHSLLSAVRRKEIEAQNVPEGGDAILPRDLLSFGVGTASVRDWNLPYASVRLGETRREFWLEAEPIRG